MDKEEFEKTLLLLAACKLSPEAWAAWWTENEAFVQSFVSRDEYLRLKPVAQGFHWAPILGSQKGAIEYLAFTASIPYTTSEKYQKNYEKELKASIKQQKAKNKEQLEALKRQYPQLFAAYPRFCNSLKNIFSEGDKIESSVTETDLKATPHQLPADIEAFFKIVSKIFVNYINIDFSALRTATICNEEYLVLGEFWKEADGDLLLIKPNETALPTPIYYYFHEMNSIKKLCNSIDDLMEKKFSHYNNRR